nr:MAG TPA: tail tape measure [Caudoviricetes sp.]
MKNLELKVILGAVDKLTAPLRGVQKQLDSLQNKVKGTTGELNRLKQQDKTANSFKELQNALQQNNQKLVEAREKAKRLTDQLRNATQPTASLKRQVAAAHKEAHKMAQAQENQRKKLNELRQSLKQGGFDTSKFKENQTKLKERINQSTAAIEKQNAAMKKLQQRQARTQSYRQRVDNLKNSSDKLKGFGQSTMIAGTAGNAITGVMLKPALDFEQDFSRVQALTGLSKANPEQAIALERLRNQGIHLGATTSFTSGEVAQGQGYLAMAGFNADQIEKSMPAILAMTKAAGIEMGRVSDISSDISSGFKISADEMGRVADVLTATFSGSNTTLEGLGDTMKYLGPIATATGQDFETMSAMVGLLGNVGIKGTQAGTSLRSAMLRLAAPPKQAAGALKKLGISAKDSRGNMRALTNILVDVERKTAKMGSGTKMAYYKAIFGTEAATAMVELVKQSGINGIQEFTNKLKNSAGRAEQVAQIMADNLMGDLKNLESAREAVGIAIYDTITVDLRQTVQSFTDLIRKANEWIKANPELTAKIAKWAAAIAITITTLGALSMAISFLFYPVARLLLGIGHLSGINGLFSSSLKKVSRESLSANKHLFSYKTTLKGLNAVKTGVITKSIAFYGWLKKLPNAFLQVIKNARHLSFWLNGLKTILRVAILPIKMLFMGLGSIIVFLLSPIGLLGTAFVTAGVLIYKNWDRVKAFFGGFWEGLKSGLAPVIEKFKPLGALFGVVVEWLEKAVKWFTDLISPVQSTQKDLDAAASAGKKFGEWLAAGIDLVTKPLQWLMDSIQWVIDNMPGIQAGAKIVENAKQSRNEETNKVIKSGSTTERILDALSDWDMYSSGGYTGNGGKYEPMGIVHGGEYVMTKETTSRLGVPLLNALNYGKNALLATGLSMSVATAAPIQVDNRPPLAAPPALAQSVAQPMAVNITINAAPGQDERTIARMVAQEMQRLQNQQQARQRSILRDRA